MFFRKTHIILTQKINAAFAVPHAIWLELEKRLLEARAAYRQRQGAIAAVRFPLASLSDTWAIEARGPSEHQPRFFCSPEFARLFSLRATLSDQGLLSLLTSIHPDDQAAFMAAHQQIFAGKPCDLSLRVIQSSGLIRLIRYRLILDAEGNQERIACWIESPTTLADKPLPSADAGLFHAAIDEERFRQLAENIKEAFWIIDLQQNRFVYLSVRPTTLLDGKPPRFDQFT